MRIRFEETWLAGDPALTADQSSPAQITSWRTDRQIQSEPGADKDEVDFCDRKNLSTTIAFETTRQLATTAEMVALIVDHGAVDPAMGVEGTIHLRIDNGPVWHEIDIPGVLRLQGPRLIGPQSVQLGYLFQGGAMRDGLSGLYGELTIEAGATLTTESGDPLIV